MIIFEPRLLDPDVAISASAPNKQREEKAWPLGKLNEVGGVNPKKASGRGRWNESLRTVSNTTLPLIMIVRRAAALILSKMYSRKSAMRNNNKSP